MSVGIEAYDGKMMELFSAIKDYDGADIPLIFARPDRAFSTLALTLGIPVGDTTKYKESIPLPFMSLFRLDPTPAPERQNTNDRYFRGIYNDAEKRAMVKSTNFLPYNITYQLELWCRDIITTNAVSDWIRWNFVRGAETMLEIDFGYPIGKKDKYTFYRSSSDNTELETEDMGFRRVSFDFEVWANMLPPYISVPTVLTVQADMYVDEVVEDSIFYSAVDTSGTNGDTYHTNKQIDGAGEQVASPALN